MKPKLSGLALASFVLGIAACTFTGTGRFPQALFGLLIAVLGFVLGAVALGLIVWGKTPLRGRFHAIVGVALGVLAFVMAVAGLARNAGRQFQQSHWERDGMPGVPRVQRFGGPARQPLTNFPTRLPIVVLHTGGQHIGREESTIIRAEFHEAGRGAALDPSSASYAGLAEIHLRGNSSLRLPKSSYTLHTLDASTNQVKVPLLGLPKEEDWVLYAPFEDKTMLRDVLAYDLARKMGHYAPRTRYVELFLNRTTGPASTQDYEGVYVLVEKIKRSPERVKVAKLDREDRAEPDISGGYIFKRDHREREGRRFSSRQTGPYFYVYPNDRAITSEQRAWLTRYLNEFESALHGPSFADPRTGYAAYLDVPSFIDAHWLIELSKNVDGFRYSSYLTKDRGGKLKTEPPWDWNRAFGNANYYDGWETDGWYWPKLRSEEISWYRRLREDPAFAAKSAARWRELRATVFDPAAINARIDEYAAELDGAQQRNFKRWPIMGRQVTCNQYVGRTYDDEVRWLKQWIGERIEWIDRQVNSSERRRESR